MSGYPVLIKSSRVGKIYSQQSKFAPGGQGDGIYQLLSVVRNGRPSLVGSVSKGGYGIVDFTTGELLYNFSDFGFVDSVTTPMLGFDSYACACEWFDPIIKKVVYLFGGWVKTPASTGATNNQTNKKSYVIATQDFKTWSVVLSDAAQAADSYQAEVSDLIPVPQGVYICRGDYMTGSAGGDMGRGVYKYTGNGVAATRLSGTSALSPYKGTVIDDKIVIAQFNASNYIVIDPFNSDAVTTPSINPKVSRVGGSNLAIPGGSFFGAIATLGRIQVIGYQNYIAVGGYTDASAVGVPLLICPNPGSGNIYRLAGWRSPIKQCAGGIIFAVNPDMTATDGDLNPAYLLWMGMGGRIKVLDIAGSFQAIEIFDDKLYYSATTSYHNDTYTRIRNESPTLKCIPIEQITNSRPPELIENISWTSYTAAGGGVNGYLGGYPTLGYSRGALTINATNAGNLTISTYSANRSSAGVAAVNLRSGTPIAFTASQTQTIDLAGYLNQGDILAFKFSVDGALVGRICLQS